MMPYNSKYIPVLLICLVSGINARTQTKARIDSLSKFLLNKFWVVDRIYENDSCYGRDSGSYYCLENYKSHGDTLWFSFKNLAYIEEPVSGKRKLQFVSCQGYFGVYGIEPNGSFEIIYFDESYNRYKWLTVYDSTSFYLKGPIEAYDTGDFISYKAVEPPEEVKSAIQRTAK